MIVTGEVSLLSRSMWRFRSAAPSTFSDVITLGPWSYFSEACVTTSLVVVAVGAAEVEAEATAVAVGVGVSTGGGGAFPHAAAAGRTSKLSGKGRFTGTIVADRRWKRN